MDNSNPFSDIEGDHKKKLEEQQEKEKERKRTEELKSKIYADYTDIVTSVLEQYGKSAFTDYEVKDWSVNGRRPNGTRMYLSVGLEFMTFEIKAYRFILQYAGSRRYYSKLTKEALIEELKELHRNEYGVGG